MRTQWFFALMLSLALMGLLVAAPAVSNNMQQAPAAPILAEEVPGNPKCSDYGYLGFKKDSPTDGSFGNGDITVTIDMNGAGTHFDWTSTIGVDLVIVKAGDSANLYSYFPEATGGGGLHGPINPVNQQPYQVSHIEFCYDLNDPTSTPTDTPTDTPSPTNTPTDLPPNTATHTPTATATDLPPDTPTFTPSPTPSDTPSPTPSDTPSPTPTDTPTDIPTSGPSPTSTDTATPTPTNTPGPSPTPTDTPTNTPSPTPSSTPTNTPTNTPGPSPTATNTGVPPQQASATPTNTDVPAGQPSPEPTNTDTPPGEAPTNTPLPPPTVTPTATPTVLPVCATLDLPALSVTSSPAQGLPGEAVTFTVTVNNTHANAIDDVVVTVALNTFVDYTSASATSGSPAYNAATNTVTLDLGSMAAGQNVVLTIQASLSANAPAGGQASANAQVTVDGNLCLTGGSAVTITPAGIPVTGFGPGWREIQSLALTVLGLLAVLVAGFAVTRRAVTRR